MFLIEKVFFLVIPLGSVIFGQNFMLFHWLALEQFVRFSAHNLFQVRSFSILPFFHFVSKHFIVFYKTTCLIYSKLLD